MNSTEQAMLKTARGSGAIGSDPVVLKYIKENADFYHRILDFGSGVFARQTKALRDKGFHHTYAYDLKINGTAEHFITRDVLFEIPWDFIMVSNVVNVQPSIQKVKELLYLLWTITAAGAQEEKDVLIVMNYALEPRKSKALTRERLEHLLSAYWVVEKLKGNTPLYVLSKGV